MKTVAVIQARIQSTRLPAKVLRSIGSQTMLQRVVHRVSQAREVDEVVVAIPESEADQILVDYAQQQGWRTSVGSEQDVLSRYVDAAKATEADRIVRITSDCPLIDPGIIDEVVLARERENADYACNFYPLRHYPRGLDCEVLTRPALMRLDQLAQQPKHREHVTLFVYDRPSGQSPVFRMASVFTPQDYSEFRWTVDTPQDLQLVRDIYQHFGESSFDWRDVLSAYEMHEGWLKVNQGTMQKVA
ncbi:MAG: glycosyltransferase family protein [Planctomycetota bacterium]